MQTVRSLRRALGALSAVLFAVAGPLVAVVPAAQASVAQSQQPTRTASTVTQPLSVTITGMTPTTARPTSTVTVQGTLTNRSGQALSGVALQAWTSTEVFQYPEQMTEYSGGNSPLQLQQAGEQYSVPASVPNGATVRWSVSFQADAFYGQFGVFPVEVLRTPAEEHVAHRAADERQLVPRLREEVAELGHDGRDVGTQQSCGGLALVSAQGSLLDDGRGF